MRESREELNKQVQEKLVPYLMKFKFQLNLSVYANNDTHDIFTFNRSDDAYIRIDHMGFHTLDSPWNMNPLLGLQGFKVSTAQFDTVPLWYWKQKIAPTETWQREAIQLTSGHYPVNSIEQIGKAITQTIFDLDNFCKDFLEKDYLVFNRIRQIRYLEYLTQVQVFGEYDAQGQKKFTIYNNKEVE
jgi:hypothetical protein